MITRRNKVRTYTPSFTEGSLRYIGGYKRDLDSLVSKIKSNEITYTTPSIKLTGVSLSKDSKIIVQRVLDISSKKLKRGIRSEVEYCLREFEGLADNLSRDEGIEAIQEIISNSSLNEEHRTSEAVSIFYTRFYEENFDYIKDLPFVFFKFALKSEFELLSSQLIPLESPSNKNLLHQEKAVNFVSKKFDEFEKSFKSALIYPLEQFEYQIERLKTGSLNIAESDPSVERFKSSVIKELQIPKKGEKKIISTDQFAALRDFDMAFFRFKSKNKTKLEEQSQEDLGSLVRVLLKTGGGKSYLSDIISLYVENSASQGISRIININPQSSEAEFEQLSIRNLESLKGAVIQLDEFHFYANFPSFYRDVELTQEEISQSELTQEEISKTEDNDFTLNQIKVYKKLKMMTQVGAIVITYGASESLEKLKLEYKDTEIDLEKEQRRLSEIDKTQLESMKSFLNSVDYQAYLNWVNITQKDLVKAYHEIACSVSEGKYETDYLLLQSQNLSKTELLKAVNSSIAKINSLYKKGGETAQYLKVIFNFFIDGFQERRANQHTSKIQTTLGKRNKTLERQEAKITLIPGFLDKIKILKAICEIDPIAYYESHYDKKIPNQSYNIIGHLKKDFPVLNDLASLGNRKSSSYEQTQRVKDIRTYKNILNLLKTYRELPKELVQRLKNSEDYLRKTELRLQDELDLLPKIRLNLFHFMKNDQVRSYFIESESRSHSRILSSKKSLLNNNQIDLSLRRDVETVKKFERSYGEIIEMGDQVIGDQVIGSLMKEISKKLPVDLASVEQKKIRKIQIILPFIDFGEFATDQTKMRNLLLLLNGISINWVLYTNSSKEAIAIKADEVYDTEMAINAAQSESFRQTKDISALFKELIRPSERKEDLHKHNVVMIYDRNNSIGGDYLDFSVDVDLIYLGIDLAKPISFNNLMQWYGRNRSFGENNEVKISSFYYGRDFLPDKEEIEKQTKIEDIVHARAYVISGLSQYQYDQSNKSALEYLDNRDQEILALNQNTLNETSEMPERKINEIEQQIKKLYEELYESLELLAEEMSSGIQVSVYTTAWEHILIKRYKHSNGNGYLILKKGSTHHLFKESLIMENGTVNGVEVVMTYGIEKYVDLSYLSSLVIDSTKEEVGNEYINYLQSLIEGISHKKITINHSTNDSSFLERQSNNEQRRAPKEKENENEPYDRAVLLQAVEKGMKEASPSFAPSNPNTLALDLKEIKQLMIVKAYYKFHDPKDIDFVEKDDKIKIRKEIDLIILDDTKSEKYRYLGYNSNSTNPLKFRQPRSEILSNIARILKEDKKEYDKLINSIIDEARKLEESIKIKRNQFGEITIEFRLSKQESYKISYVSHDEDVFNTSDYSELLRKLNSEGVYKVGRTKEFLDQRALSDLLGKIRNFESKGTKLAKIEKLEQEINSLEQLDKISDETTTRAIADSKALQGIPEDADIEMLDDKFKKLEETVKAVRVYFENEISGLNKAIDELGITDSLSPEQSEEEITSLSELEKKKDFLTETLEILKEEKRKKEELEEKKKNLANQIREITVELLQDGSVEEDKLMNEDLATLQKLLEELQLEEKEKKKEFIVKIVNTSESVFYDKDEEKTINLPNNDAGDSEIHLTEESLKSLSLSKLRKISELLDSEHESLKAKEIELILELNRGIGCLKNKYNQKKETVSDNVETGEKSLQELRELSTSLKQNLKETESSIISLANLLFAQARDIFSIGIDSPDYIAYITHENRNIVFGAKKDNENIVIKARAKVPNRDLSKLTIAKETYDNSNCTALDESSDFALVINNSVQGQEENFNQFIGRISDEILEEIEEQKKHDIKQLKLFISDCLRFSRITAGASQFRVSNRKEVGCFLFVPENAPQQTLKIEDGKITRIISEDGKDSEELKIFEISSMLEVVNSLSQNKSNVKNSGCVVLGVGSGRSLSSGTASSFATFPTPYPSPTEANQVSSQNQRRNSSLGRDNSGR